MRVASVVVAWVVFGTILVFLPISVPTIVIAECAISAAAIVALVLICGPDLGKEALEKAGHLSQLITSTLTAIALVGAAVIYYFDTAQWDEKMSVELAANAFPLESHPKQVLVQIVLKIANQSRQAVTFEDIRVSLGFLKDQSYYPDNNGDIQLTDSRSFPSPKPKIVGAGETDYGYFEIVAPCQPGLVRVLAKLPSKRRFLGRDLVYQRKLIVPIAQLCAGKDHEIRVPFSG
jgi:hypothetical protein